MASFTVCVDFFIIILYFKDLRFYVWQNNLNSMSTTYYLFWSFQLHLTIYQQMDMGEIVSPVLVKRFRYL